MIARFFIDRPIFASVLSILIVLAGGIAVVKLPLAQYPPIAPPTVQVDCNYPGASSQVVAEAVASPIEQQVNGVEGMLYMNSQCTNDGGYTLSVTFKTGVDLNVAQVLVQNRVSLALPQLPDVVRQTGVTTKKRSPELLLTISLNSPTGRYDQLYLSNYASIHLVDEILRLPGISDIRVFGQRDYSMRVWVDPEKLAARSLSVTDVTAAIAEQNKPVALGQVGQPPMRASQPIQITLNTTGRLTEIEQFENITVKSTPEGRIVRLKDVARIELGARNEDISNRFDVKPTVGIAIFPLSDANALDTGDAVKAKMDELSKEFPDGMIYEIGYDTTPFIRESVDEVYKALRDAILLVALVVMVFLQNWRSALIPLVAVPVAIVGTFAAMALAGFTINNLTLFGLVLAVGIVVDDAIVVVEAIEHYVEKGLGPRAAAIKAMEEVSGPVIAVGLVLSAVFVPCAFVSGIVGLFFRQFALTIAISTILSTFNSLTLSPALAAILLRPRHGKRDILSRAIDFFLGRFFRLFNRSFDFSTRIYLGVVRRCIRLTVLVLAVYVGMLFLTVWGFRSLPTGFIPAQDKGYLLASVQTPDASYVGRTKDVIDKLSRIALSEPGVKHVNGVAGNSFLLSAAGSNFGSAFIILEEFDKRRDPELYSDKIMARLKKRFADDMPEATVSIFGPPAVSGLGRAGGFRIMIEQRGEIDLPTLQRQTDELVEKGNKTAGLTGLFTVFRANTPQLFADVDRNECMAQGVELADVFATLQGFLGSRYVNDINLFGRTWQVIVQADTRFRNDLEDVRRLRVRNRRGDMVPLGTLASVRPVNGLQILTRYNMYTAAAINGNTAAGFSTGQMMESMQALCKRELLPSMSFEWTEIAYLEQQSSDTGMVIFGFSVVFVFLVLAALYESWSLPLAVILVVPMCVLSSIAGIAWAKLDINIFTQVGFVVLVGLASKNAILIVEFAKLKREAGSEREQAVLEACQLRLRPILMTSFAFVLGVVPLLVSTGAGAEMRRTLGTAVFSGMLGVTFFGLFLTPVFFVVVDWASTNLMRSSRWLRHANSLSLDVLTLRGARHLAGYMRRRLEKRED